MEEWRDIIGFEGLYQVSNEGRVKRILQTKPAKQLNIQYNRVSLSKGNYKKTFKIDFLVGMAFLPKAPMMECLKHKNGNEKDNRADNLEWENKTMQEKVSELIIKSKFVGVTNWKMGNDVVRFSLANSSEYAICDIQDWEKIRQHRWHLGINGYPATRIKGKTICLHQFLVAKEKGYVIDHVNRNRLDNRRENLRYASLRVNSINRAASSNSGHLGIYILKSGRYQVKIKSSGKSVSLGTYNTLEEAIDVRAKAEAEYHNPIIEKETHI